MLIRTLAAIPLLLLAAALPSYAPAAGAEADRGRDGADVLTPFVAVYEARATVLGLGGDVTMELEPAGDPGVYVFRTVSQPRGLASLVADPEVQCSLLHHEDGRLSPLLYHEEAGEDSSTIRFLWRDMTAISRYKGREATLELEPGTLDRASEQIAVRRDLAAGRSPLGPYRTIERNEYRTIEYRPEGTAEVSAPAGTYETVAYRRHRVGSSRSVLIHYASELDWIAVKIEQFKGDKKQVTALLKEYRPGARRTDQARGSVTPRCP